MTKIILILLTSLYIFIFNLIVNNSASNIILTFNSFLAFLLVSFIISFLGTKILKLFLSIQIFLASVALFFKYQYHATITDDIILSGLINDISLSLEMVSLKLIIWVALTAGIPIYFILKINIKKELFFKSLQKSFTISLTVLISLVTTLYLEGYDIRHRGQKG